MKPASAVAGVFKAILISTLLMIIVGSVWNIYIIFETQKKIEAVGDSMKAELSKNNSILYESIDDFGEQLKAIDATSVGAYVFKNIEIVKKDSNGADLPIVIVENVGADQPVKLSIPDENTYYGKVQGEYGEFVTIRLNYDINVSILSYNKAEKGLTDIRERTSTANTSFDYTTPCLRYMK